MTALEILEDTATAIPLALAGCYGILTARLLEGRDRGAAYWRIAGVGLLYLGIDEMFGLHELYANGLALTGVPLHPGGVNALNDAFIVVYGLAGLVITLFFAREVVRIRAVLALYLLALGVTGVAVFADAFAAKGQASTDVIEEGGEVVGAVLFACALGLRYRYAIRLTGERAPLSPLAALLPLWWRDTRAGRRAR